MLLPAIPSFAARFLPTMPALKLPTLSDAVTPLMHPADAVARLNQIITPIVSSGGGGVEKLLVQRAAEGSEPTSGSFLNVELLSHASLSDISLFALLGLWGIGGSLILIKGLAGMVHDRLYGAKDNKHKVLETQAGFTIIPDDVWVASADGSAPAKNAAPKTVSPYDVHLKKLVDAANISTYPGAEDEKSLSLRERARLDAEVLCHKTDSPRGILIRTRFMVTRDCVKQDMKSIESLLSSPLQDEQFMAVEKMEALKELMQRLAYFATVYAESMRISSTPGYPTVIKGIADLESKYSSLLEDCGWSDASLDWAGMALLHDKIVMARTPQEVAQVMDSANPV